MTLLLLPIGTIYGQNPAQRHGSHADLVVIDVQAYSKSTGASINDLSKKDFEITDNGVLREITYFDFRTAPLDLALLMDVSGSMTDIPRRMALGTATALCYLGPHDRIAVLSFSSACRVELKFTSDRDSIVEAIETAAARAKPGRESSSRLYDALAEALRLFDAESEPILRKALVAVTDDREQKSKVRLDTLIVVALRKDVTVNALIRREYPSFQDGPPGPWPPRPEPPTLPLPIPRPRAPADAFQRSMRRLVEATGGECVHPRTMDDAFSVMFDRIRARYLLGYAPQPPRRKDSVHRIRVRLSERARLAHPDALLRARSSYTY